MCVFRNGLRATWVPMTVSAAHVMQEKYSFKGILPLFSKFSLRQQLHICTFFNRFVFRSCYLFCLHNSLKHSLFCWWSVVKRNSRSLDPAQGTDQAWRWDLQSPVKELWAWTGAWAEPGLASDTGEMMRVYLGRWEDSMSGSFLFPVVIFQHLQQDVNLHNKYVASMLLPWLKWRSYNLSKILSMD